MPDFDGPRDFLAKLRDGRPVGHHWDEPRPWSAASASQHHQPVETGPVPIIHAIVLGLVQGLSEFLPISSSGHLLLVPWLFNWHDFDNTAIEKAFDVALHIGTLVAVVGYFRRDLVRLRPRRRRWSCDRDGRRSPGGPAGVAARAVVDPGRHRRRALREDHRQHSSASRAIIAVSLIVFGVLLGLSDRRAGHRALDRLRRAATPSRSAPRRCLSLNPGTSRSGITITAGRFLGFTRDCAARASFLMAIPVTAGAIVYKMAKLAKDGVPHGLGVPMVVGIVTSAIAGWAAVWGTLRLIRTRSFMPFVIYRCRARRRRAGHRRHRLALTHYGLAAAHSRSFLRGQEGAVGSCGHKNVRRPSFERSPDRGHHVLWLLDDLRSR